ncbi:hypothetical protein BaRGS_00026019 [Batillaria attramentaria]|uniref:Methyltransferase domain-containing protein n=1 Tax=Batillaria attramentaria TaxID=370345 RepID=A0ABD0K5V9_9CAEN
MADGSRAKSLRIILALLAAFASGLMLGHHSSRVAEKLSPASQLALPVSRSLKPNPPVHTPTRSSPKLQKVPAKPATVMDMKMEVLREYGDTHVIPDQATLHTYSLVQLSALWHSYLDHIDIVCKRHLRMGSLGDGGYEICDDIEWRPIRPCIVYSFGIRNDFSFDDDVATVYGCDVFSFDPYTYGSSPKQPDHVTFFRKGIGETTHGNIYTLSDLKKMLNHTEAVIDVLKIDIEENEWAALRNLIKERQLINVRQLFIEYHHLFYAKDETRETFLSRLAQLRAVQELGFLIFYTHKYYFNTCTRKSVAFPVVRTSCYEVHYVNVNFMRET